VSLDSALEAWVTSAVPKWTEPRRRAVMARIGWRGPAVPTLDEVGVGIGLTRERVRQLQKKLTGRLEQVRPPQREAFQFVVQLISNNRGDATQRPGRLLRDHGLVMQPLPEAGLALLFRLLGQSEVLDGYLEAYYDKQPALREVVRVAKDLTRSVGVACLEWVEADSSQSTDDAAIRRELQAAPWCRWLDDDWFWDPKTPRGRNRLVNLSVKMLAACGQLELREVREGLDRSVRNGRLPHLPSLHALRLFYRDHPDFEVDAREVVTSVRPLDPDEELDGTELIFYRILRDAPDAFLDRATLFRQATDAGMNQNTFSVYSSYSPIVDSPMQDRWILRGTDVSPAALEARRSPRRRRYAHDEWTSRGTLRLERETTYNWSLVTNVSKALKPYVAGRVFEAIDGAGADAGRVRWDENGASWGYSVFLQRVGAKDGDVLIAEFNLVEGTVALSLSPRGAGVSS
jgi:hypothetical protein